MPLLAQLMQQATGRGWFSCSHTLAGQLTHAHTTRASTPILMSLGPVARGEEKRGHLFLIHSTTWQMEVLSYHALVTSGPAHLHLA